MSQIQDVQDGKWVTTIDVRRFMEPHPEDRRTPRPDRPLVVPVRWWAQVLGVSEQEVTRTLVRERGTLPSQYGYVSREETWQIVADKPFVIVTGRERDECAGDLAQLRHSLVCAKQMHKGEFGRKPELANKPRVFRSRVSDPDEAEVVSRVEEELEVQRSSINWVNLQELANLVQMSSEDVLRTFAGFSDSTYYEPNVPILCGAFATKNITRVYTHILPLSFCWGEAQLGGSQAIHLDGFSELVEQHGTHLWVPQSFAHAVLRLVQFGYRGAETIAEPTFMLDAAEPEVPTMPLPILSVEQLRELHELRLLLPSEVTREHFVAAAEETLVPRFHYAERWMDGNLWQRSKVMGDRDGGCGKYYTDFDRLDLTLGNHQITIARCDWTRAGAYKSPNYYAGLLTVRPSVNPLRKQFPNMEDDPRRDESALLRLWFWPGELVRSLPTGSKGGVCPSTLPDEVVEHVKKFLGLLGYNI